MSWWLESAARDLATTPTVVAPPKAVERIGDWTGFGRVPRGDRWRREFLIAMHGDVLPSMRWMGIDGRRVWGCPIPDNCPVADVHDKRGTVWLSVCRDMVSEEIAAWTLGVPKIYVQLYRTLVDYQAVELVTRSVWGGSEFRQSWVPWYYVIEMAEFMRDNGVELAADPWPTNRCLRGASVLLLRRRGCRIPTELLKSIGIDYFNGINPWTGYPYEAQTWHEVETENRMRPRRRERMLPRKLDPRLLDRLSRCSLRDAMRTTPSLLPSIYAFRQRLGHLSRLTSTFRSRSAGS